MSVYSEGFRNLVEGHFAILVKDGVLQERQMKRSLITEDDLRAALHTYGVFDLSRVNEARLERNGHVTVKTNQGESR